jgi:hypothetical protein
MNLLDIMSIHQLPCFVVKNLIRNVQGKLLSPNLTCTILNRMMFFPLHSNFLNQNNIEGFLILQFATLSVHSLMILDPVYFLQHLV